MSTFCTPIHVEVEAIKRLLPKQHFLEAITWNPIMQTVDIVWSTPALKTPFSTPQLFPIQNLHDQSLPKGVEYRTQPPPPVSVPPPAVDKPVDKHKNKRVKQS